MFKVIIAGTRTFSDYELLKRKCDKILGDKAPDIEIVNGGARGADRLGGKYAIEKGYKMKQFPADWSLGKAAGYLRNHEMAKYADAAIIFWDEKSKGAKHMIDLALKEDIGLRIITY